MNHELEIAIKANGNGVDLGAGEKAKGSIRYNAENDTTWKYQKLAKSLYGWTDTFRDELIDPIARLDRQGKLPGPVIGFERFDIRVLAYYRLGKNAFGLDDEIVLNERHLERPLYSILETVLHEQIHLWQQRFGEHPVTRNYHNKEFCEKCESIGLHPLPVVGSHYLPADGAFEDLLRRNGILKPPFRFPVGEGERRNWWEEPGKERKGSSTLILYECPCGQKIRVGRRDWPGAHCDGCGQPYEQKTFQTLYQRKGDK